jgi:ATP-dependent helicase/nuclease subunit B
LAAALENFRSQLERLRRRESSELHRSEPRTALSDGELADAAELVRRLTAALAPLEEFDDGSQPLAEFASRHRTVLAALSKDNGSQAAFSGPDGKKIADALDELTVSGAAARLPIAKSDYVELFAAILSGRIVRQDPQPGAAVRIFGPLEARLTDNDRVVLGGLVEGTWPPESNSDAWLSRPMRLVLGLDLPERRIGLSAHDFAQLFNAREVFLTRAAKIDGAPSMPSRFIQRLGAVSGVRWNEVRTGGERF